MQYRSLLLTLGDPPAFVLNGDLLPDHTATVIGQVPVFASVAPWVAQHDLLIDPDQRIFAGIVYPVAVRERSAVLAICGHFPGRAVRYCISPRFAADWVRQISLGGMPGTLDPTTLSRDWGDPAANVAGFPKPLRPVRQLLRDCLLGRRDRLEIPPDLRSLAGEYFQAMAQADYATEWPDGDVDRVEVTWSPKPMLESLPDYFPSALTVRPAQQFAEDIWFYRQENGDLVGVGVNHLDEILKDFRLQLPRGMSTSIPTAGPT
jgi:hypothetical protein